VATAHTEVISNFSSTAC